MWSRERKGGPDLVRHGCSHPLIRASRAPSIDSRGHEIVLSPTSSGDMEILGRLRKDNELLCPVVYLVDSNKRVATALLQMIGARG